MHASGRGESFQRPTLTTSWLGVAEGATSWGTCSRCATAITARRPPPRIVIGDDRDSANLREMRRGVSQRSLNERAGLLKGMLEGAGSKEGDRLRDVREAVQTPGPGSSTQSRPLLLSGVFDESARHMRGVRGRLCPQQSSTGVFGRM